MNSLGSLSVAQALHERICLLYLLLMGGTGMAAAMARFDLETGWGLTAAFDREALTKRLVDALWHYEQVTMGQVHPVNAELDTVMV